MPEGTLIPRCRIVGAERVVSSLAPGWFRVGNNRLAMGHFLGHVQKELAVFLASLAQETPKFA
jgi:hypothetical protein